MDTVDLEIDGIVIANEIFDSLPFHRLKVVDGGLEEILVLYDKNKDEFIETYGNIEDEEIIKLLLESEFEFVENQELEVSTNSRKLLTEINSLLKNGLILIIDYGYLSKELYSSKRLNGTYKCLYKHKIIKNPYINIGNQDITAHVNFDYLTSIGKEFGFSLLKYTTQSQFLIDWGILEIIEKYSDKEINDQENINSRLAIKTLLLPEFMGESFKVLLMSKGESKYLKNFYTDTEFKMSFRLL